MKRQVSKQDGQAFLSIHILGFFFLDTYDRSKGENLLLYSVHRQSRAANRHRSSPDNYAFDLFMVYPFDLVL